MDDRVRRAFESYPLDGVDPAPLDQLIDEGLTRRRRHRIVTQGVAAGVVALGVGAFLLTSGRGGTTRSIPAGVGSEA